MSQTLCDSSNNLVYCMYLCHCHVLAPLVCKYVAHAQLTTRESMLIQIFLNCIIPCEFCIIIHKHIQHVHMGGLHSFKCNAIYPIDHLQKYHNTLCLSLQNFAWALFPVFLGTYNGPQRDWKQCLCKILEGRAKSFMVFLKVVFCSLTTFTNFRGREAYNQMVSVWI